MRFIFTSLLLVYFDLQSLNKKRSALREVQDKLARLQEKYEANVKKKADLEKQVRACHSSLCFLCDASRICNVFVNVFDVVCF